LGDIASVNGIEGPPRSRNSLLIAVGPRTIFFFEARPVHVAVAVEDHDDVYVDDHVDVLVDEVSTRRRWLKARVPVT